jgi:hypothetical protein
LANQQGDFDHFAEVLAQVIDRVYADVRALTPAYRFGDAELMPFQEVLLVGWSQRAQRMCGEYQALGPGAAAFSTRNVINPYLLAPEFGESGLPPNPDTPEKLEAIARKQAAWGKVEHPDYAIGEQLVIADGRAPSAPQDQDQRSCHPA